MNKKLLIFSIFLITLFVFSCEPSLALAQGRKLETTYPFAGGSTPQYISTNVTDYVNYIFNFLLWGSGIFALVILIMAGFGYLTSAGDVGKMSTAKSKIWAALGGLGILFGSYIILTTINPQLIFLNLPTLKPLVSLSEEGVWLCKSAQGSNAVEDAFILSYNYKFVANLTHEELKSIQQGLDNDKIKIKSDCYQVSNKGDIRSDFDNKSTTISFVPDLTNADYCEREYGAIVYEKQGFGGEAEPKINHLNPSKTCQAYTSIINIKASSIKPFRLLYQPDPAWGTTLYEEEKMNQAFTGAQSADYFMSDPQCSSWWCEFNLGFPPKSLAIFGETLVILENTNNRKSSTFSEDVNNLTQDLNISEQYTYECESYSLDMPGGLCVGYRPVANKLTLISGAIY
jgi:hypothetical protein